MKNIYNSVAKAGFALFLMMGFVLTAVSQTPTFVCELRNDSLENAKNLVFDVYIVNTSPGGTTVFEYNNMQLGITFNSAIKNGGTVSASYVSGYSDLSSAQEWLPINVSINTGGVKVTVRTPSVGVGNGTIISTTAPGTRLGRFRLTNTNDFGQVQANLGFSFATSPWPTKVFAYLPGSTNITASGTFLTSGLSNPILNQSIQYFTVMGSGSYCQGNTGLSVTLSGSQSAGLNYVLYKDGIQQGGAALGTGAAMNFGTQLSGTYTIKAHRIATYMYADMTGSAVVAEDPTTVGGSIAGGSTVFTGNTSGTLTLVGNVGTVLNWQSSTNEGASWDNISNTENWYISGPLSETTWFRAQVQSGSCTSAFSIPAIVTVTTAPVIYNLTGSGSYCPGLQGISIQLDGSEPAISYQLFKNSIAFGDPIVGNGLPIQWDNMLEGTYSVVATNITYMVSSTMNGTASISEFPIPAVPIIEGDNLPCKLSTKTYTTLAGMSSYSWSVTTGGSVIDGGTVNDNFITIDWNSIGTSSISVNYMDQNGCISATPGSLDIMINALPLPTISGLIEVCAGDTTTYDTDSDMSDYVWTVSAGGTILSGNNGNTVSIIWSSDGSQSISVNYTNTNGCTATAPTILNVLVHPLPIPSLTGLTSVCEGASGVTYVTEGGMSNYQWSISAGGSITTGKTVAINSINVTWNTAGPQSIGVNYTNSNGCTAASEVLLPIMVNALPIPDLTGPTSVCLGNSVNYSTEAGMNGYTWQISSGGTITSGSTSETITVLWNTTGNQTVSVNYSSLDGCTAVSSSQIDVNVHGLPTPVVTGPASACNGAIQTFGTQSGMLNYSWDLSTGGSIIPSLTDNEINVLWETPGDHSIFVNYTDIFGCTAPQPTLFPVSVHPLPTPTIIGATSVCVGSESNVYSTEVCMTAYNWAISSGGTITAGGGINDNTVEVVWNNEGNQWLSVNYTNSNNCTAASAVSTNVVVLPLPTANISYSAASFCPEGTALVTQTGQAGGTYSSDPQGLSINNMTGEINLQNSLAGTYQVTYLFTDGTCANSTQTTVSVFALPSATISYTGSPYCKTGIANVTINGQTGGIFSSTSGLIINQNTGEIDLEGSEVGTYLVTYEFTDGNCTNTTSTSLSINPLPIPSVFGEVVVCEGSTNVAYSTETGMNAYTWQLSTGGSIMSGLGTNTILVNWNTAGNQYVAVNYTTSEGCMASSASQLNVVANPLPGNTGPIAGSTSVCLGSEEVAYSIDPVQNAIAYQWVLPEGAMGVSTTNEISVSYSNTAISGFIKVKALNACAESNESAQYVNILSLPNADFGYSVPYNAIPTLFQDLSTTSNGVITNWLWDFGDGSTSNLQNPMHTYTSYGDYTVQVTIVTSLGCSSTSSKTVSVNEYIPFSAPYTYTDSIGLQVNTPVSLPIKVDNFTDVTAISLRLDYNPQVLAFNGFANINPLLNDVMVYNTDVNPTLSKILISWSDIVPTTLPNGQKILDLQFNYISGSTDLIWNNTSNMGQECEFADLNGVPMTDEPTTAYYKNGNIHYRPDWQFDGSFVYNNSQSTPLDSLSVILIQNGFNIDTVLTNATGGFNFPHVPNGIYRVNAYSNKPWQGVNSTDAAKIQRHFIGIEPLAEPVNISSGDVNNSQFINATDALQVKRRFAGLSNYFARGNWTFSKALLGGDTIIINGACLTQDFYGLCVGDVNGSNSLSTGDWNTQKVHLASEGIIEVTPGQLFEVPLRVVNPLQVTAISLVIPFPQDLFEPIIVSLPQGEPIYNITNNQIRIAWSELEMLSLQAGETLLTLKFRAKEAFKGDLSFNFLATNESEFADENGDAIHNTELSSLTVIPYKATGINDGAKLLNTCTLYPNPARDEANLTLDLNTRSSVTCTLCNALGETSTILNEQGYQKGTANIKLNTQPFNPGIYQLVIQINAVDHNVRLVKKLVIE